MLWYEISFYCEKQISSMVHNCLIVSMHITKIIYWRGTGKFLVVINKVASPLVTVRGHWLRCTTDFFWYLILYKFVKRRITKICTAEFLQLSNFDSSCRQVSRIFPWVLCYEDIINVHQLVLQSDFNLCFSYILTNVLKLATPDHGTGSSFWLAEGARSRLQR